MRRGPNRGEITLSVDAVERAAAESLANLFAVISWSLLLLSVHVVICLLLIPSSWQLTIIITSKFGLFGTIVAQQFSVMTCSCHYKGVSTWVVPEGEWHSGPSWRQTDGKQKYFLSLVKNNIGRNYLGRALLLAIVWLWPLSSRLVATVWGVQLGQKVFETFSSPANEEYLQAENNSLTVTVADDDDTIRARRGELFSIRFRRLPELVRYHMESYISPSLLEMRIFGGIMFVPALAGVFEPVIMLLGFKRKIFFFFFLSKLWLG